MTANDKYTAYREARDAHLAAEDALEALASALRGMENSFVASEVEMLKNDLDSLTMSLNDHNYPRPKNYKAPQTWADEKS
jgi:hypothetical protein